MMREKDSQAFVPSYVVSSKGETQVEGAGGGGGSVDLSLSVYRALDHSTVLPAEFSVSINVAVTVILRRSILTIIPSALAVFEDVYNDEEF